MKVARRFGRQFSAVLWGIFVVVALLGSGTSVAADAASLRSRLQELESQDAAKLAPETHKKAAQAVAILGSGGANATRLDTAEKRVDELAEAMTRARRLWTRELQRREQARAAGADTAAASWRTAENVLDGAARKLEAGRRDAAERQATSLAALYDQAHKEAVHHSLVGRTRQLLLEAEKGKAGEYTPRSYVRALDAVERTEKLIASGDIGETSAAEAERARREAEHALFLLETIREGCEGENKARLESIILEWETYLQRVLDHFGAQGDFTRGPGPVLQQIQVEGDRVVRERNRLRIDLARRSDQVDSLQRVISELRDNVRNFEGLVAELEPFREEANTVTAVRSLITQSEGKVLVDDRDVVLRLHGLRFASGDAKLPPESVPLLDKIVEAVRGFPGARVVVEGHTDSRGNANTNMRLSTERANAVRDYLVQQGNIAADRLSAAGRGATQPVASNDSEDGRVYNRRIDVIISRSN